MREKDRNIDYEQLIRHLSMGNKIRSAIIFLLVAICMAQMVLCAFLGSQSKSVPYVIELAPDGKATFFRDAVKLLKNFTPNEIQQRYFMMHYVSSLRSVSLDNYVNEENVASVCACTTKNGNALISEFYEKNNPILRSESEMAIIPMEEISVVQYSRNKWKMTWREKIYRRYDKALLSDRLYEGIFDVDFFSPSKESDLERNPLGMYIVNFDIDMLRSMI